MTDPKETNEELSTEELKSVNGGVTPCGKVTHNHCNGGVTHNSGYWGGGIPSSPHGSGFGGTREDWEKSKFKGIYQSIFETL